VAPLVSLTPSPSTPPSLTREGGGVRHPTLQTHKPFAWGCQTPSRNPGTSNPKFSWFSDSAPERNVAGQSGGGGGISPLP
jgi:hypothetical protein